MVGADPIHDVAFKLARHPGQHIDEAVRVGRNEIDRRVARAHLAHRARDRKPPTARVSRIADMTSADEPQHDPAFLALDGRQVGVESVSPRLMQTAPVVLCRSGRLPRLVL